MADDTTGGSRPGGSPPPRTRDDRNGRGSPRPAEPGIERKEVVTAARGDQYVRIRRANGGIRRLGSGHLEATRESLRARSGAGRVFEFVKEHVVGAPLANAELAHERLSKVKALPVFSSDALSSSAYATEEILRVLILAGLAAMSLTFPIALSIAVLLAIVATSYVQVIKAYPQGGGSYVVTKDNLGTWPALITGGSLLIDYILTVAVSVSAGVAAVTSAVPNLRPWTVELAMLFIAVVTLINLRGTRESGSIFAIPTYLFVVMTLLMIGLGLFRLLTEGPGAFQTHTPVPSALEPLTVLLVLRAFASGNAALTGTEAISDGVPAFKPPAARNASITLTYMALILGTLFLGISFLAVQFGVLPSHEETVVSQLGRIAYGDGSVLYFVYQAATALILFLAANTSFSGFPILGYFLARDHFIPHQFQFRGDRLSFTAGILVLGSVSALVVALFHAETHALIPLYALGVFLSFTLSQSGMVARWWKRRDAGWRTGLPINALGALTTGLVTIIIAVTKFEGGAWAIIVLIPVLVFVMHAIHRHYQLVAEQTVLPDLRQPLKVLPEPTVLVPVPGLNKAVEHTLAVARALSDNVTAVHVSDDPEAGQQLRDEWTAWAGDIPLVILESPYRSLLGPLVTYVDLLQKTDSARPIVVVLSEFVPRHFWEYFLHNQSALRLKTSLFFRPNTVVMDVPFHLER